MRKDFRLFKLGRMTDLSVGGGFEKRVVPFPDLSAARLFPCKYQVKARVAPEYKWRLVEDYGPDSFSAEPDGSLLFSGGFADKVSVITWIISFGAGAELLEPEELRADVRAFAEGIRRKYEKDFADN